MSIKLAYKRQFDDFCLDVEFEIPNQGITVLFGPSGSGKSSLLNLIAGLDDAIGKESYSKFLLKQTVYDDSTKQIKLKPWQRNIGYVFQDSRLFPNMTVNENIKFGYERRSSSLDIEEVIARFKIGELLRHYPAQLSGGQKQRVAMVRALLSNPDLLILDEPLASLDFKSREELLPYIESIHRELTIPVIHVSHDIKEVLRLADYIVVLNHGKVIDQGLLADLCISQPLLTEAEGSSFILQGEVSAIHTDDKLVQVNCENIDIWIADQQLQKNQAVRILIHARDVSLCLSPPKDSSILNCVPISIENLEAETNGKIKVVAKMGKQTIVSMISYRSARELKVEKGREMYAQFKATAMIK